jgi:glycosyltransferase involved in cell wall biosynthesis
VIPVRDAEATLADQLAALQRQDFKGRWEVIVVDDGSDDDSWAVAEGWLHRLPNLRIVRSPGHGSSSARNAGAKAAQADRLLFCDADDVVSASWLRTMLDTLDQFDLAGGALEYRRLNTRRSLESRNLIQRNGLTTALGHLPYASGANLGVRRPAFDNVQGFDVSLDAATDADFCWRVQYAGHSIGFEPLAVVHYRFRATRSAMKRQVYAYALANQALYAKHCRLGHIKTPPRSRYNGAAFELLRVIVQFPFLLSARRRWRYLGRVARCRGSIVGLVRYRIRPW